MSELRHQRRNEHDIDHMQVGSGGEMEPCGRLRARPARKIGRHSPEHPAIGRLPETAGSDRLRQRRAARSLDIGFQRGEQG